MPNWEIDYNKLEQACTAYGMKYPVRVRLLKNGPMGMAGKYHGIGHWGPTTEERLAEPTHHITLDAGLSASMANTCAWHELTHARQGERFLPEDVTGDEAYRIANRGLAMAFREEMKQVRRDEGTTSKALTWKYGDVSFEVEARASDKFAEKFSIIKVSDEAPIEPDQLLDDEGRASWRVDIWMLGKWNKEKKYRELDGFRGTYYVVAKTKWGAEDFAKREWGKNSDKADAYQILPRPKRNDKDEEEVAA